VSACCHLGIHSGHVHGAHQAASVAAWAPHLHSFIHSCYTCSIFVGVSGILTGGTDATVIEPLVTAAGAVIMGGGPVSYFDTCFGVGQMVIAMNGWQDMPPTAIVEVMRGVYGLPASQPSQDGAPNKTDAVMVAMTCLAQYAVKLVDELRDDIQQAGERLLQQQQSTTGCPATDSHTQATSLQAAAAAVILQPLNAPRPVLQVPRYHSAASTMVSARSKGLCM